MPRQVFISHHTATAGTLVSQIAAVLEKNKISCWYAPRDTNPRDGSFVTSITKAMRNCAVFLLILDQEANYSRYVSSEVGFMISRVLKEKPQTVILPVHVDECDICDELWFFTWEYPMIKIKTPLSEGDAVECVRRTKEALGLVNSR